MTPIVPSFFNITSKAPGGMPKAKLWVLVILGQKAVDIADRRSDRPLPPENRPWLGECPPPGSALESAAAAGPGNCNTTRTSATVGLELHPAPQPGGDADRPARTGNSPAPAFDH